VLGVLPYLHGLMLDAEDAIATTQRSCGRPQKNRRRQNQGCRAGLVPRVSNHNDLDPLRLHPEVDFRWIGPGESRRLPT
jgi:adenosylcobyric acid synthase